MGKAMHVPHGTLDKLAHSRWYHCAVHVYLSQTIFFLPLSTYNYIMIHHHPLLHQTARSALCQTVLVISFA